MMISISYLINLMIFEFKLILEQSSPDWMKDDSHAVLGPRETRKSNQELA